MWMMMALLMTGAQAPLPVIIRRRPAKREAVEAPAPADSEPEAAAPEKATPTPVPRKAALGEWSLGLARGGVRCTLTLSDHGWGGGLSTATPGANCPDALFAVSRWRLQGEVLTLSQRNGRVLARFTLGDGGAARSWRGRLADDETGVVMERRL